MISLFFGLLGEELYLSKNWDIKLWLFEIVKCKGVLVLRFVFVVLLRSCLMFIWFIVERKEYMENLVGSLLEILIYFCNKIFRFFLLFLLVIMCIGYFLVELFFDKL